MSYFSIYFMIFLVNLNFLMQIIVDFKLFLGKIYANELFYFFYLFLQATSQFFTSSTGWTLLRLWSKILSEEYKIWYVYKIIWEIVVQNCHLARSVSPVAKNKFNNYNNISNRYSKPYQSVFINTFLTNIE